MPAQDVETTLNDLTFKTRVGQIIIDNPLDSSLKNLMFSLHFVQKYASGNISRPILTGESRHRVLDLLTKTFNVPDGQGGTIPVTGAMILEWFDLFGEELCVDAHPGLLERFLPTEGSPSPSPAP